ncbi:MAG TPA: NAD-dependent epimerase/dehydratase family protein [Candidatus Eisenbacteria bacterium]
MSLRVFITGATGYIGSAVAARLARAGHEIVGLTRREANAAILERAGIRPIVGDLAKPATFIGALKNCDAVVHAATDPRAWAENDQKALEAFRAAAQDGRVRRLLYTSGIWVHGDTGGRVVDETTPLEPAELVRWRVAHEEIALDMADDEVEVVVLRPAVVYGESRGIIGGLFAEAREKRTVTVPGDGTQHWELIHRDDVAEAYRLALEYAHGGERYLLTDEAHHTAGEVGEAIARATGAAVKRWDAAAVVRDLGRYGEALLLSQQATAAKARRELGWVPGHTSFVAGVEGLYAEWQSGRPAKVG